MADEWYYGSQGSEIGPVTWETLKQMIAQNHLSRNVLVKQGENGRPILAKRVKGLVDLSTTPLVIPGQPSATKSPSAPTPVAPRKPASPTISFVPAKSKNESALPPMALPPTSGPNKPVAANPPPTPPAPHSAPKPPKPAPAAQPKQPPPPPASSHPPHEKKAKKKKAIDDLLPPTAG